MGSAFGHGDRLRTADHRLDGVPIDRAALGFDRIRIAAVDREADRQLARREELGDQDVAFAHFRPQAGEPAEKIKAALLAHEIDHAVHPVGVGRLEREPTFPFRLGEGLERPGKLLALDLRRVVAHHPDIGAVAQPAPVRRHRPGRQIGEIRRVKLPHHLFARQRFHLGRVGLHDIHRMAPPARLGDGALQHLFAQRAPELNLDPVFALERGRERAGFGGGHRGVEGERPLLARLRCQSLEAIGALVQIE